MTNQKFINNKNGKTVLVYSVTANGDVKFAYPKSKIYTKTLAEFEAEFSPV